jgi:tetratricopeptide (TPR) repeat protein
MALAAMVGCQERHAPADQPAMTSARADAQPTTRPATLVQGLGDVQHTVSTKNPQAQKFFNQGLAYVYGFNHAEAVRSFARAAELDPTLAMAWWGKALALGPNINKDVDPAEEKAAYVAVQKAMSLAGNATPVEQAYIRALSVRYSDRPDADLKKLAVEYHRAMGELVKQFPDDLDAATLYAESGMNLRPWKLYTRDGKPEEGTEEIVATLESVLARNPNHTGANHYYIHATEASLQPQRALASAQRLPALAPGAGHLVHMPAHVYIRIGDYPSAVKANQEAIASDDKYISCCKPPAGVYPLMYYNHNVHFLAVAACMTNQSKLALSSAQKLYDDASPAAKEIPFVEPFCTLRELVRVRFAMWDEILNEPAPPESMLATTAAWHFARGMAFAARGNLSDAGAEQAAFAVASSKVKDAMFGNNSVTNVLQVATHLLAGRIALARGDQGAGIEHLRLAVQAQDELGYDEPAPIPWPVRESLGAALLRQGDAADAERVFRRDLELNPNNPRSLIGLLASLRAQNKPSREIQAAVDQAIKPAEIQLKVEDF